MEFFLTRERIEQLLDFNMYHNVKNHKKTKSIHILLNLKLKKIKFNRKSTKKNNFAKILILIS